MGRAWAGCENPGGPCPARHRPGGRPPPAEAMDSGDRLEALGKVLVGGIEKRAIRIVDWQAEWAEVYEVHRARIARALGPGAARIAHIGSTSVPGLAAKPIVDILVAVPDPDDEGGFEPAMVAAGYELRVREPGHRMFRTRSRDVQVHFWPEGSEDERRHLLFRDWLRRSEADRRLYERTKRELARRDWPDVNLYADAKTEVISEIMERAEQWRRRPSG